MTVQLISGIALLSASTALAQTSPATQAPITAQSASQTLALTGCVSGGGNSQPFTLANPVVVPAGGTSASTTVSPAPGPTGTVQPAAPAGTSAATGSVAPGISPTAPVGTPSAPAGTSAAAAAGSTHQPAAPTGATGATGSAGTSAGTGSAAGATGTTGAAGTSVAAGTSGTSASGRVGAPTGTVDASAGGATGSATTATGAMNGYRLTGTDMSNWKGQRVQIIGTLVPATSGPAAASGPQLPEFRVQRVQPITGSCPQE